MISVEEHRRLLRQVMTLGPGFDDAVQRLRGYGWDGRQEVATLSREDVLTILQGAIDGTIPDARLARWADELEGREDVGLDPHVRDELLDLLFELSSPVTGSRAPEVLARWSERLGRADGVVVEGG